MISKELLSAVLGKEDLEIRGCLDKHLPSDFQYIEDMINVKIINIHELQHKCKLFALENGYEILESVRITRVYLGSDIKPIHEVKSDINYDVKRVFKACEYIIGEL